MQMFERQQPKRPFLLKDYLPEKKRRNTGYLETWNTMRECVCVGGGVSDIQNWHCILRSILHVLLAYFATKNWTLHN